MASDHARTDKLILFTHRPWADLDQAVDGLSAEEATARHDGGSSIAWTVGRVAHMLDSWMNTKFQGLPPHPVISQSKFRSGASRAADDCLDRLVAPTVGYCPC